MSNAFSRRSMRDFLVPDAGQDGKAPTSEEPVEDSQEAAADDLPAKYKGKSVSEIVEMHRNAEKRLGEIQNELGVTRGLVSDLASIQRSQPAPSTEDQDEQIELTSDDLLRDPVAGITKIVSAQTRQADLKRQEDVLASQVTAETNSLYSDYPDLESVISTPEFVEWAKRKPSRVADFQTAATAEGIEQVRAARRLLDNYSDLVDSTPSEEPAKKKPTPVEKARQASNESGNTNQQVATGEVFYQDEVVDLIRTNPGKWRSPTFQKEFKKAVAEGRYVSN